MNANRLSLSRIISSCGVIQRLRTKPLGLGARSERPQDEDRRADGLLDRGRRWYSRLLTRSTVEDASGCAATRDQVSRIRVGGRSIEKCLSRIIFYFSPSSPPPTVSRKIKVIKYVFQNWYRWSELISLFHLFIYDSACRCNKYCHARNRVCRYIAEFVFIAWILKLCVSMKSGKCWIVKNSRGLIDMLKKNDV